jgi:hypothetical protein
MLNRRWKVYKDDANQEDEMAVPNVDVEEERGVNDNTNGAAADIFDLCDVKD